VKQIKKLNLKMMTLVIRKAMEMQRTYTALGFSRMTSMVKNGLNVCGTIVGRMKTVGLRKKNLCAPCAEKV
jgi:hypothetical protein